MPTLNVLAKFRSCKRGTNVLRNFIFIFIRNENTSVNVKYNNVMAIGTTVQKHRMEYINVLA